jgi:hypothetical protein
VSHTSTRAAAEAAYNYLRDLWVSGQRDSACVQQARARLAALATELANTTQGSEQRFWRGLTRVGGDHAAA